MLEHLLVPGEWEMPYSPSLSPSFEGSHLKQAVELPAEGLEISFDEIECR